MTISQGRHLNFTLHPIIQMSEQIVFRFTVLNFGTVFPKTLQIQHISQYLKNDVLSLCIKTLQFQFKFSYSCNLSVFFLSLIFCSRYSLCFSFFLCFYFIFFSYCAFLLFKSTYTLTFSIVMYVILCICTDLIKVDDWNDNIVNMGLW